MSNTDALPSQNLSQVYDYYCTLRGSSDGQKRSIYQIWESEEAFNDSVTPSTYSKEYRSHIGMKMLSLTREQDKIFSIGCGNAFIEADLSDQGRSVHGIDCNSEAVQLASSKGVNAFKCDFFDLPDGYLSKFKLIYADGFLGHLYLPETRLDTFFSKLASLNVLPGTWIVISNDAPLTPNLLVQSHPKVKDFWFLSRSYLNSLLLAFGFYDIENYYFPYLRPKSGQRNRTVCIARVPETISTLE